MAATHNGPAEKSDNGAGESGTIIQEVNAVTKGNNAAIKNKILVALAGTSASFKINFKPSATGCKTPQKPTILGPIRRWLLAIILRSANVKNATDNKTPTNKKTYPNKSSQKPIIS